MPGLPILATTPTGDATYGMPHDRYWIALNHSSPFLKPPRVRVISTSAARRTPQTAEWASAADAGLSGVDASIWVGMFAPKGVPKAVVDLLYRETVEVLKLPDVRERYAVVGGAEAVGMPPAEFLARIKKDAARYKQVVRSVGITPQ